jgi:uncharacterized protein (DUF1684 family)
MESDEFHALLDWRRQVAELFSTLRQRAPDAGTLAWFRAAKDTLYRTHPQSPIPVSARMRFTGLRYWDWDPTMRVEARLVADATVAPPSDGEVPVQRFGTLEFELGGAPTRLAALWITGYAGGLFLPFRDATCGSETYGGGRYLLDTIKSADLGSDLARGTVILDFNYAYHPSCAYDPRWVCPLAPPESRLAIPIRAGERLL